MSISNWLQELTDAGRARVPSPAAIEDDDWRAADQILIVLDAAARLDAPFEAPAFDGKAARWAALLLYRACQFLIYRDVDAGTVSAVLNDACPVELSASVAWSADLVFRHFPEFMSLARGVSESDPLVVVMTQLCRYYPLSSVGVRGVQEVYADDVLDHPCLRRIYADRIIERSDASRLEDARVIEAIREGVGQYVSLASVLRVQIMHSSESA